MIIELLDAAAEQCINDSEITEEKVLSMFAFLMAGRLKLLEAAIEFLDEGRITEYRTADHSRALWKVKGSSGAEYTVFIYLFLIQLLLKVLFRYSGNIVLAEVFLNLREFCHQTPLYSIFNNILHIYVLIPSIL